MRDAQVYKMHESEARRVALLYKQFEFLMTRMEAYETVLSSRKAMLRAIWNPAWLKGAVDEIQTALLKVSQEKMREAAGKIKVFGTNGNG